jgi:hypothetical protein
MSCQLCNWNKPNSKLANHLKSKMHLDAVKKEQEIQTIHQQTEVTDELDCLESLMKADTASLAKTLSEKLNKIVAHDQGKDEKDQKYTKYRFLITQLLLQMNRSKMQNIKSLGK